MADRTASGAEVHERNEQIAFRRQKLQALQLSAAIMSAEIDIDQMRGSIAEREKQILATKEQLEKVEAEISAKEKQSHG